EAEFREPLAVVTDLGAVDVDDLADLAQVIAGIGLDLLLRQPSARLVTTRWVADEGSVVADDKDRLMAEFLELAQLPQGNGVAEVDVDAGGIDAVLDAERLAGLDAAFELFPQLRLGFDLLHPAADHCQLFIDRFHDRALVNCTSGNVQRPRRHEG